MGFVNPAYLFALAGMLVPLAIHLWSKKEGRVIKIGSTQFLPEVESKKSSSIRINEIWLLILRMLMVATLSFILIQPFFNASSDFDQKAAFIDPEIVDDLRTTNVIDSLLTQGYNLFWFTPGFPEYKSKVKSKPVSYWHLLKDLEDFNASELVVISSARQSALIGQRPKINRSISWLNIDTTDPNQFMVSVVPVNDQFLITRGDSDATATTFSRFYKGDKTDIENYNGTVVLMTDTVFVRIIADPQFETEKKYLRAAFESIKDITQWPVILTERKGAHWLVMLSDTLVSTGENEYQIRYKHDSLAQKLLLPGDKTSTYWLTARLNEQNVIEQNLALQLFEIIRSTVIDDEKLLTENDKRMASNQQIQPNYISAGGFEDLTKTFITPYLWVLLLLLFFAERTLSMLRKQ